MTANLPAAQNSPEPEELRGERVARSQPLQPGHYWRAKHAIKDDERIPKGCVLLLQRIKRVDDVPHAVEMAGHPLLHPNSNFTFLVNDFLDKFEPEPRGAAIRAEEMAKIQAQVAEEQRELLEFQSNPAKLMAALRTDLALPAPKQKKGADAGLPAVFDLAAGFPGDGFRPSTSIVDLAEGRDKEQVELLRRRAENQAVAATKLATVIRERTEVIGQMVGQLTPFYEEMGAVALAQASDALDMYGKLKSGLATLGLYTGKDVEVTVVRAGEPAPADAPIHVLQALLYMDEESLINLAEGGARPKEFPEFVELLKTDDALLDRLIPFPRGIAAMRYRHEPSEETTTDPWVLARIHDEQMKTFLLIRSGERVSIVHSEINEMKRMFPTAKDLDQPFERGGSWRGVESERITVEDLDFSEARGKLDAVVLHYRRVLILLAGLYDRERHVIGDVAALVGRSGLALLSLGMQEQVFRPVSDEEFALGAGRPDFWKWVSEKNSLAQSGSRLLCNWRTLMTSDTAPGAVTRTDGRDRYSDSFNYDPKEDTAIVVAEREHGQIIVRCPVEGFSHSAGEDREFNATVNVSKFGKSGLGYLCLDDVTPEEINYYIRTRHDRTGYIKYIRILLAARDAVAKDLVHEAPLRRELIDALQARGLRVHGAEHSQAVGTVIRRWRAARRGAAVPFPSEPGYKPALYSMLDQLWVLAGQGRDRKAAAEAIAKAEGREPLRLALHGRARLVLYATATEAEREDLLGDHPWVVRLQLEELKTKVSIVDRRHVVLPAIDAKEEVLAEWDGVGKWVAPELPHSLAYGDVRALRDLGREAVARAERWLAPVDDAAFDARLAVVRDDTHARSKSFVTHGWLFLPLAVVRQSKHERSWDADEEKYTPTVKHKFFVAGVSVQAPDAIYKSATAKQRAKIVAWFQSQYRNPKSAVESLGAKGHLAIAEVDECPSILKSNFTSFSGHYVRGAPKKRDWEKDFAAILAHVKDSGYGGYKVTSEPVLRFDDAAARVYGLLTKPVHGG